jgi:hypothetical protein
MVKAITINTLHPIKKSGVVMHEKIYNMVSDFIFDMVGKEKKLTMSRLLEEADLNFPDPLEGNLAWHLYYVRLDLEARGLLKITRIETGTRYGMLVLKLTRKGIERLRKQPILLQEDRT